MNDVTIQGSNDNIKLLSVFSVQALSTYHKSMIGHE